ncbi:fibronectin type III domain-containing protein [Nonomuraea basaltis]|uniref:fibronectin type III domain-containing protein n=1 Tax=Nonomuraea basaltis TaxID=2495887 RepID=UPI00110C4632|nr:fibronectin type III domain-containing protein [Nonomuraea basaltis]TMR93287.1 fibronectin type III domain-containing protein [Nonomuraea basaltis]
MSLVRMATPYTTQSASSSHTYSFGSASYGNRIVLFVQSYASINSISGGYEEHEWASNTLGIRMLSKISYGGDSSVTVTTSNSTDRIFMWMYELSNADEYYGSSSGVTTGSASMSASGLPDGCVALLGISVYVTGSDNTNYSWPSGFTHRGVTWRDWTDGNARRVWSASASRDFLSGSFSMSQQLVTGLPSGLSYAWSGGVWGPTPDEEPPSVPGNLRLTAMTPTSLTVTWEASSDSGTGVSGYGVYKNGAKDGADQSGRAKTFSGLTPGVPVTVEVDAVDGKGNRSEKASITLTPINDTTPPLTPVPRVTALAAGSITVEWDQPYDQTAITGYGIFLNGQKQGSDQTTRTRTFTGLTAGGLYTVGVDAKDLLGNRSAIGTKTVKAQPDTSPPTLPGSVRLVAVTQTAVTISWDASSDDNVGLDGYGLYLGATRIAQVGPASQVFTFTQLTPGITYSLGVDAVDGLGNRSARVPLSATTLEDSTGAAPPYEFVLYDWASHRPLDSLPLQNVSFDLALGGGGSLTAEIPLYDEDYTVGRVEAATRSERTMLLIYRGERFVGGGRVVDPTDYDSETGILRISVEDVTGIYSRRFIPFTGPRTGTLAHTEIDWILNLTGVEADKRWLVTSGVPGTVPVDREYRQEDFSRAGDTVGDIAAAPGGFEWWAKPAWDPENDRPRFELRRVNRDDPPSSILTLEYPGNVKKFRRSTRPGLATVVYGKLALSEGGVLIERVVRDDLHGAGWPKLEQAYTFEGLTSPQALKDETQRAADASKGARMVFEFELVPGTNVRWWEWELGANVPVIIANDHLYPERPDGSPGLEREMKIISIRVQPNTDEGELVTVTTAELTTAVDDSLPGGGPIGGTS